MERLNNMGYKKKKCYVVWAGHQPGIYQTWAECNTHTDGFPSAEFKSFKTLEEAQTALQERELIDPHTKPDKNLNTKRLKGN
jgi:viroplasmin and RNaseH domain-containing protein